MQEIILLFGSNGFACPKTFSGNRDLNILNFLFFTNGLIDGSTGGGELGGSVLGVLGLLRHPEISYIV